MSKVFNIKEHVVDAQHIREYARATAHSQEEVLQLAVKQYIPKDNPNPKPGDITVIASHANGFVKVILIILEWGGGGRREEEKKRRRETSRAI